MKIFINKKFHCLLVILGMLTVSSVFCDMEFNTILDATNLLKSKSEDITIERQNDATSYRIQNKGEESIFVPVLEIETEDVDNCQLQYTARMRSEEGTQKAYLEMHCIIDGNSFFSKALNDVVSGETTWKSVSTPFFLKKGEHAQKAVLGVRFEGSGVVFLENLALHQYDNTLVRKLKGNWQWIPGTLFGVFGGLYGGFVGLNAQKGRAKALVYGIWIFFVCISILMLIAGIALLLIGQPYSNWYAFLLPGVLGVAIFSPMIVTLNRAYRQAEARKMHARDAI